MANEENQDKYEEFFDKLDNIWDAVDGSAIPKFKGAKYRTVDADEIKVLIDDFKNGVPAEMRRANSVLAEANDIISDAESKASELVGDAERKAANTMKKVELDTQAMTDEANDYFESKHFEGDKYYKTQTENGDAYYNNKLEEAQREAGRIISEAVAERDRLVSETEIIRVANETAEKIVNEAENRAAELRRKTVLKSNEVYTSAKESADSVLAELMGYLGKYYNAVEKDRNAIGIMQRQRNASASHQQTDGSDEPSDESQEYEDDQENDDDGNETQFHFRDLFKRRKKKNNEDDDEEDEDEGDYDDMNEE